MLLAYSANPSSFGPASSGASGPRPPPPGSPAATFRRGWRIPAADLTLLLRWPLGLVWSGGTSSLKFLRGVPCGCQVGCARCHGTAVVLETVRVQVQVPPLPSRSHRVRLVGVGHRGDDGHAGDVWLEIAWKRFGSWKFQDGGLYQEVPHLPDARWLYVTAPGGGVARVPLRGALIWTSPGGLVARILPRPVARWSWGHYRQAWCAFRWGWSHADRWWRRPLCAIPAFLACGRETPRCTSTP